MMICPPGAEFIRQAKADTLDAWFILHLLVCKECCGKHVIGCMARKWSEKNREEEGIYWEPMDPQARDWMYLMLTYPDLFPESVD